MLFGAKESFAIDCELLVGHGFRSDQPFGHVIFWAGNEKIGNQDEVTMISGLASFLRRSSGWTGRRSRADLFKKPALAVLSEIETAVFGEHYRDADDAWWGSADLRKFVVCPNGSESFDGWLAVIVEGTNSDRLIWREDAQPAEAREATLQKSTYSSVITSFLDWLDRNTNYRRDLA